MYQAPVGNIDKIRKARKAVKNILCEIGLEDCQDLLKDLKEKSAEKNPEEEVVFQGTEWIDMTEGYTMRMQKKWPYRSRALCCMLCKYSSKNIYNFRSHVSRCHGYVQSFCALTPCSQCGFIGHPKVVKRHMMFFHAKLPVPNTHIQLAREGSVATHHGNERYQCRKCGFPTSSIFALKKHVILKHLQGLAEQYIGYRLHTQGTASVKIYCCKVCKVSTGTLDQMLHHMLVEPSHYSVGTQVQSMICENKNFIIKQTPNGNGLFLTLPSIAPKSQQLQMQNNRPSLVIPSNGQSTGTVVALQQVPGAANSTTLICAPGTNQTFLPPQASALVQLASAEAKGLLQPGATIALQNALPQGSSMVQIPTVSNVSLKQAPITLAPAPPQQAPQTQQLLVAPGPQINVAAGAVPKPSLGSLNQIMGAQNQIAPTQNQIMGTQNQIAHTQNQIMGAHNQIAHTQSQIMGAHNQIAHTQNQIMGAHNQIAPTQNQIMGAHNQIAPTQNQIMGAHNQIAPTQNQIMGAHNQIAPTQNQIMGAHNQIAPTQNQIMGAHNQIAPTQNQIMGAHNQIAPTQNQVTLQGTMLTSQSLLNHLFPTGNKVNGMPTYTFVAMPNSQTTSTPQKAVEQTSNSTPQTKKWITCPLCNELFPSSVFDMHTVVAHQSKPNSSARSESVAARAPFLKKLPDKTVRCLTCKILLSEKSLFQHLLHGLNCLYCSALFFSIRQLVDHVKQHNPTSKAYCDFLRQKFRLYTKATGELSFPYFDVNTTAPKEVLGDTEVNLALVTNHLELIFFKLQPNNQGEICSTPAKINCRSCPFCDEKFQQEFEHLQHLKQKHFVAPTIHAILKTEAFKCIYCNGVYTGKVTQQAVMLHIQRCRCSPKPPQPPKPVAAPLQLSKPLQLQQQLSQTPGLYFVQMPQGLTMKQTLTTSRVVPPLRPQERPVTEAELESKRRLEAALRKAIEDNKREREQKAAMRKKREQEKLLPPPEPEIKRDPAVKLLLEPTSVERRNSEERRDFISKYFNVNPYTTKAETEELCRRLSLTKSELVSQFSKKRSRCMKHLKRNKAAILLGFNMTELNKLKHGLFIPEQQPPPETTDQLPEEEMTDQTENGKEGPEPMDESVSEQVNEGGPEPMVESVNEVADGEQVEQME
ncbi:activity-dependent neuroprotector homeobox protein 2b [Pholidichthys leucotaenia]